jgi:superfamily II DNA helicase RecQ
VRVLVFDREDDGDFGIKAFDLLRCEGARAAASSEDALEAQLRAWRSAEAKKRAFRILTDRTLLGIAEARPTSEAQLLAVSGMGMTLLQKYGSALLAIVAGVRRDPDRRG